MASVDDSVDSYIPYQALGRSSSRVYDYRQPRHPYSTSSASTPSRLLHDAVRQPHVVIPYSLSELDDESPSSVDDESPSSDSPLTMHDDDASSSPSTPMPTATTPSADPTPHPATTLPTTSPLAPPTVTRISADTLATFLPAGLTAPPAVCPCDTPNGSDSRRHLTADAIYRLFGNRRFRNYQNFCLASKDAKFINSGDPVPSLGEYATIPKRKRGPALPRPQRALDKVHMDIVFGDGLGQMGYRYALLFVDCSTRYIWVVGLKSLHADSLISAFSQFRAEAGRLAVQFRCDCDTKLLSHQVLLWLRANGSDVASAPAGRQSSNGLVE